jgi:hypothetical protein
MTGCVNHPFVFPRHFRTSGQSSRQARQVFFKGFEATFFMIDKSVPPNPGTMRASGKEHRSEQTM